MFWLAWLDSRRMKASWVAMLWELRVSSLYVNSVPPLMVSSNQTCFLLSVLLYQFFLAMLPGWAWMQVSRVVKSQKTLMASLMQPWLGSIQ